MGVSVIFFSFLCVQYAGHYFVDAEHLRVVAGDHDLLYYRHAVAVTCPDLDMTTFKEFSAEASILAGLEKELLRFDELVVKYNIYIYIN